MSSNGNSATFFSYVWVKSLFNAMLGDGLANYITRFLTNSERNPIRISSIYFRLTNKYMLRLFG